MNDNTKILLVALILSILFGAIAYRIVLRQRQESAEVDRIGRELEAEAIKSLESFKKLKELDGDQPKSK